MKVFDFLLNTAIILIEMKSIYSFLANNNNNNKYTFKRHKRSLLIILSH